MEDTSSTFQQGNSSPSSLDFSLCPTAATLIFLPSIYALLFLTALPGNMLSLWVFLRCISTISPTHVYLSHLSISNLLLCLTSPFLAAYYAHGSAWALNDILCQLVLHGITPVLHINIYISLLILTWVALCRFAALIQNTHASRPSTLITLLPHGFFTRLTKVTFANTVCVIVWVVSVGGIVPVTVYYSVNEAMSSTTSTEDEKGECMKVCYSPPVELGGSTSATLTVPVIIMFFVFYLLVLLCYMTVLRHIRRSRRNTPLSTSQNLLTRVFRNIVVIQVVLSVCLLPYHIYKPIFISLAHDQLELAFTYGPEICNSCHPLSTFIELKNCLFLLAALRGSTDPVMYFVLDQKFRHQTLKLLRCNQKNQWRRLIFWSTTSNPKAEQTGEGNVGTATADLSHESVL
ncbi:probable G-protein coupled receptor 82 [Parambassis ranga]|uniref:Probable G-protein coupled receptor 82 n=1 Tax=Parambassis ranga TaxID=210632 RepID=A0A6P7H4Z8_9TELE|nr:probable G-protein coupled receptor 82 [Parambassis ranga]